MGTTYDNKTVRDRTTLHTYRQHWTVIILEEQDDGDWLATQGGVPVEGYGDTAAAAAAEYCRKISEADDE